MHLSDTQINNELLSLKKKPDDYLYLSKASKHTVDNTIGVYPREIETKKNLIFYEDSTGIIYELPKTYKKYDKLPKKTLPKSDGFFYKVPLSDFKILKTIVLEEPQIEEKEEKTPEPAFDITKTIYNLPINSNTHIENIIELIRISSGNDSARTNIKDLTDNCLTAYMRIINAVQNI